MAKCTTAVLVGLVLAACLTAPALAAIYDVKEYGATGDGETPDTEAINKAIDAAAAAGGGTVHFPAGAYLSGSIHLKDDIRLYLDQGATIEAIGDPAAYDPPEDNKWGDLGYQDFGHSHFHNSLIWGEDVENVTIEGPGLIHGKGLGRSLNRWDNLPENWYQNKAIALKNCRNVLLRDISILHGGHFAILATGVNNLTIDHLKIDTNRDAIDIDCCRNVTVSNTRINSPWDDAICLKSSYALGEARATENVTITNCLVAGGWEEGTLLDGTYILARQGYRVNNTGRIKFGTESNGGFKNISISNCIFTDCQGIALETVDGGLLEDVTITNITMRNIVSMPIFLRLGSRMRGPEGVPVGALRRINISNIVVYDSRSRAASTISGIPGHNIEDVRISNVQFYLDGGGTAEQAAIEPPENENAYPEPTMFGTLPSYGFFVRHVDGLEMDGIKLVTTDPDMRPPFYLFDVSDADFNNIDAPKVDEVPTFVLKEVDNLGIRDVDGVDDTRLESVQDSRL